MIIQNKTIVLRRQKIFPTMGSNSSLFYFNNKIHSFVFHAGMKVASREMRVDGPWSYNSIHTKTIHFLRLKSCARF